MRAPELPTGPVAGQPVVPPPVPHGQPQEVWDVDAVSRDASDAEPLFEEGTEPEGHPALSAGMPPQALCPPQIGALCRTRPLRQHRRPTLPGVGREALGGNQRLTSDGPRW
ncbi:UNVERIFIED_CONTAM: hypothetical protein FKN15_070232 [Acipenser sinensis]